MKSLFSKNSLFLLLAAFIWGIAFVAQTVGMDYIGPFTFGGIRYLLGFLVLLPAVFFRCRKDRSILKNPVRKKSLLLGGLCCGIFLFAASSLQHTRRFREAVCCLHLLQISRHPGSKEQGSTLPLHAPLFLRLAV